MMLRHLTLLNNGNLTNVYLGAYNVVLIYDFASYRSTSIQWGRRSTFYIRRIPLHRSNKQFTFFGIISNG